MSQIFEYNGVQLEMNMLNAKFLERYENAFDRMGEAERRLAAEPQIGRGSAFIRKYCAMFFQLYDDIFGEGTADKMFHGECDMYKVDESYAEFIKTAQSGADERERSQQQWKYAINREQRRNKGNHNKKRYKR